MHGPDNMKKDMRRLAMPRLPEAIHRLQGRQWRIFRLTSSPVFVVTSIWLVAILVYAIAESAGGSWSYFQFLVASENLIDGSSAESFFWLGLAWLAFVLGTVLVQLNATPVLMPADDIDDRRLVRATLITFAFTLMIAFLWVGVAIIDFGGLGQLAALAASENTRAREVILSASFPGGRLVSSGFMGLAVFSITQLAKGGSTSGGTRRRFMLRLVFIVSMIYLALIPILISGRIIFFVACIGAFVAASNVARRPVGLMYISLGAVSLIAVWTAKQYFSLAHVVTATAVAEASVAEQGWQGIVFYFYNDLLNAVNTIGKFEGYYTYGWYSLRFVFYMTFTNRFFSQEIADSLAYIAPLVPAGEVPLLSAPFVDFGVFGLIVLFLMGAYCQHVYHSSIRHTSHAALYGILFAGLLMSVHSSFITSQEVVYNLILIYLLARWSRPRKRR